MKLLLAVLRSGFLSATLVMLIFAQLYAQDPKMTEVWAPAPPIVASGIGGAPPSDAVVLFDGKNLANWAGKDGSAKWLVKNGAFTVVKGAGDIWTKRAFGDVQLHIEWRTPKKIEGEGQERGNSGVFLQGRYEVQILDSYDNRTYANGQAGSIYKQFIPLVNTSRKPGEWQAYDIIFIAPRFNADYSLMVPAKMTVFHNGILIQNQVELQGETVYIGKPGYTFHAAKEPLRLQDHGCPVSFKNIWLREL